jgi:TATA-binding protein-associated factor Taf7
MQTKKMNPRELDKLEEDIESKLNRDNHIRSVSSRLDKLKLKSRNKRGQSTAFDTYENKDNKLQYSLALPAI